jgi:hypothetical protein
LLIRSAAITNPLLFADCQFACFETRKKVVCGKPGGQHPICPSGQGGETVVDRGRLIAVEVKPVGKGVDVFSSGTGSESLSSYR